MSSSPEQAPDPNASQAKSPRWHYMQLTISILILLVVGAFLEGERAETILGILFLAVVLSALRTLKIYPLAFKIALVLAATTIEPACPEPRRAAPRARVPNDIASTAHVNAQTLHTFM